MDQNGWQDVDWQVDRERSEVGPRKEFEGGVGACLPLMRPLAGVRGHCALMLCAALSDSQLGS